LVDLSSLKNNIQLNIEEKKNLSKSLTSFTYHFIKIQVLHKLNKLEISNKL